MSEAAMSSWLAVLCKPRREQLAEENLHNQGYEVYLPRMIVERRRRGQWTETIEALFPRYLFLNALNREKSLAPVRSTLGVCDFVRFGGMPARVPESVIAQLRAREDPASGAHTRSSAFREGDRVRVVSGPFAGLEGIFEGASGRDRVVVLMELLGRTNRLTIERDSLVPAG